MTTITGKKVLLTGAAGGIGQAIARRLAQAGAELVLTGRNREILTALGSELKAQVIVADIATPEGVRALLEQAGAADILIANAGLPAPSSGGQGTFDEIAAVLDVNLLAPVLMTRGLMKGMRSRGGGHLVYISSLAGRVASPLSPVYSASKWGLRGFAQSLRLATQGSGIGVSCVFPGIIRDAGMFVSSGARPPKGIGTNTPDEVALGVIQAIEQNRAEVMVAPLTLKIWCRFSDIFPGLASWIQTRAGAQKVVAGFDEKPR